MRLISAFITLFFVLFLSGKTAGAFPINEIRSEGISAEQSEQIRGVSGIFPGDEFEKIRVERATEKIRDYFESKGFPQNEVEYELITKGEGHTLKFKVRLGTALKIAALDFLSSDPGLTSELTQKLQKIADIKPGERFDRDRIKEIKRAVEVSLTAQNFIDSRVREITTAATESGIRLGFVLELGQRVTISVQGNQYFSKSELIELIESQRSLGLGRDYVTVISNRIRDQYVDRGFKKVSITPYFFEAHGNEAKKVLFEIEEGQQVQIHSVVFDGNEVFTESELGTLFFKIAPDRIRARIYNAKLVESAAAGLIEELKKRGYLSARLIGIKTDEAQDGKTVSIRIFLSEGVQTHVQAIEFRGNQIMATSQLEKSLAILEGDPLDLSKLEDGLDRIKRDYRNLGYLDFRFTNEVASTTPIVSYSEKNQFAYLTFELSEGAIYTVGGVEIFGNDSTRLKVIEREVRLHEGDPVSESKMIETEERLRRLGVFSQVNLELKPKDGEPRQRILKISVQEAIPGNTTAGLGFRNDLGVRGFGGLSYSNLWGLNHTWAMDLTVNRRITNYRFVEYRAQMNYTLPWVFAGDTTLRPGISAEKRQYLEFDAETFAFNATLERMLLRSIKLSGALGYTLERIRQFNAIDSTQDQQITIGSITPTLRLDLRDNPLTPKSGLFAMTSFEYANSFLGTQSNPVPISYGRYQVRTDLYWNFVPEVVWFGSFRGGWLKNFVNPYQANGTLDSRINVPLIKQFALGGVNSIRGFSEQEINVQASDRDRRVQGFLTYVNYRTQIDFFPSPQVSIGPFLDAGNLQTDSFSLGNLRFGSGIGLRYMTPVGPVNFDWGFKLFPRAGETPNVFYFSLGVI